jgi:hypothetical protein
MRTQSDAAAAIILTGQGQCLTTGPLRVTGKLMPSAVNSSGIYVFALP